MKTKRKNGSSRLTVKKILIILIITVLSVGGVALVIYHWQPAPHPEQDYLLYNTSDTHTLMRYNPQTDTHEPLLHNHLYQSRIFPYGQGRFVYTAVQSGHNDIYRVNGLDDAPVPENITNTPLIPETIKGWNPQRTRLVYKTGTLWDEDEPNRTLYIWEDEQHIALFHNISTARIAWHPDGTRLAYNVYDNEAQQPRILIWDGEKNTDITPELMPDTLFLIFLKWSAGDYLSVGINYLIEEEKRFHTATYIWQGDRLMLLNPADISMDALSWSPQNQLLLKTYTTTSSRLFVWDSARWQDNSSSGQPDLSALTEIALETNSPGTFGMWSPDNHLFFVATPPGQDTEQVYRWNGQTITRFEALPSMSWMRNSPWHPENSLKAFADGYQVYILDASDELMTTINGTDPAWSAGNFLTLCHNGMLRVWDRASNTIRDIKYSSDINGTWLMSGNSTTCRVF